MSLTRKLVFCADRGASLASMRQDEWVTLPVCVRIFTRSSGRGSFAQGMSATFHASIRAAGDET